MYLCVCCAYVIFPRRFFSSFKIIDNYLSILEEKLKGVLIVPTLKTLRACFF